MGSVPFHAKLPDKKHTLQSYLSLLTIDKQNHYPTLKTFKYLLFVIWAANNLSTAKTRHLVNQTLLQEVDTQLFPS